MAFWNNWGDFVGDVKSIATGHNPANQAPPQHIPTGPTGPNTLPVAPQPKSTGQGTTMSTQPVYPTLPVDDPSSGDGSDGGNSIFGEIIGFVKNHAGDIASALGDFAKKYGTTALEAYNIYQAAQRQAKSDQYGQDALNTSKDAYNAKAPLRASGIAGLMDPKANTPDLSRITALSTSKSGNPFARGGALPVAPLNPMQHPEVAQPTDSHPTIPIAPPQHFVPDGPPPIQPLSPQTPPGPQQITKPVLPPVGPPRTLPIAPPDRPTDVDPNQLTRVM